MFQVDIKSFKRTPIHYLSTLNLDFQYTRETLCRDFGFIVNLIYTVSRYSFTLWCDEVSLAKFVCNRSNPRVTNSSIFKLGPFLSLISHKKNLGTNKYKY